jgi:hypothetical protein
MSSGHTESAVLPGSKWRNKRVRHTEVDGTRRQNAYSFPTLAACEAAEVRMKETITKTEAVLGVSSQAKFECEPVEGETV